MAALSGAKAPNPYVARLAKALRVNGQGSLAAGAANAAGAAGATGPAKPGFHPLAVLKNFEPGKPLTGKDMAQAARALTVLETRPVIHGYKQIEKQLGTQKASEAQGLSNLGARTEGNVGSVYKNIAASEAASLATQSALGARLTGGAADIAQTGNQELAATQTGALGDYEKQLQMRGAPAGGGAQEALAQAVAAQSTAANSDNQAAQQFAGSQAANSEALQAALAGSAQMQGGEAVGAIGRDTVARVGESDQKFDQGIQEAAGKLGEAKAAYGPSFTKNLLGLRGNEQKFILGKDAVQGEKAKLAATVAQNAASNTIAQENANSSAESAAASARNAATTAWKAAHPEATLKEEQKAKKYIGEVKSFLPSAVSTFGAPKNPKQLNQFIGAIDGKVSAPPQIVRSVLERWYHKQTIKNIKAPGFP